MFVLLDLEWVEERGLRYPTQLAARRVDAHWVTVASFDTLVRPRLPECSQWDHMAYRGYMPEDFRAALEEGTCIRQFCQWLMKSDILCCWHRGTVETLSSCYKRIMKKKFPFHWMSINNAVYAQSQEDGIEARGLYALAKEYGLVVPDVEHKSSHDVFAMQSLLQHLNFDPKAAKRTLQLSKKLMLPGERQEHNKKVIEKAGYEYIYAPGSGIFHRRGCKLALQAKTICGCRRYATAAKNRRPCKRCRPGPPVKAEHKAIVPSLDAPAKQMKQGGETVAVKLLGGEWASVSKGKIIGFCHSSLHPGKMTVKMMKAHDCINKACWYFEKYADAPYWQQLEARKEKKRKDKEKLRLQKAKDAAEEGRMEELRRLFQEYVDKAGYRMQIVRVHQQNPQVFKVFYVSDNAFADGNRFGLFLRNVKSSYPGYRVILRHIQDMEKRFVTIEEFMHRRR